MRSIHQLLLTRLLILAILLSILIGSGVFFREQALLKETIAERIGLSSEILRLRVLDFAELSQKPWQGLVQKALEDLSHAAPHSSFGHLVWVSIRNAEGKEIASLVDKDFPNPQALIEAANGYSLTSDGNLKVGFLQKCNGQFCFVISTSTADAAGQTLATLRGVYAVVPEVMADLWWKIARSVGLSILIVMLVTALHYPVIRRLLDNLGKLSIHLLDANLETLQGFGSAIAKRDSDTDAHNYRVTIYAVRLAEAAGLEAASIRTLIKGAFLHDIGKIGIRDHILLKPGRLTEDEFEVMKTHVLHGLDIVEKCHWLRDASEVVGNHHEKFDGGGYYGGLKAEEIPITARIFAIVDVFDALNSERPYKAPLSLDESMAVLQLGAANHFDPVLLEIFGKIADQLYRNFARDEDRAKLELARITERYFKGDIGELFYGLSQ